VAYRGAVEHVLCGGTACSHHRELARLRRNLHDGLGPSLAGIMIRADLLGQVLVRDEAAGLLQELRQEASSFLAEMRRLLSDRLPRELESRNLAEGLSLLASRLSAGVDISVTVAPEVANVDWDTQEAVFWIAREALTNVVKHADARTCTVRVWADKGLHLSVVDDGEGGLANTGAGLSSMRTRAAEHGGHCDITDTGRGIAVTAHLPEGWSSYDRAA
jgi:signal transduction histidine kinase